MSAVRLDVSNRRAVSSYLELPARLSRADSRMVPLQAADAFDLSKKHPFYEHSQAAFFLAGDVSRPEGRLAVMVNRPFNRAHGTRTAFFTHFECSNSPAAAGELFSAAMDWARGEGMTQLIGPVGFLQSDARGMMIRGHDGICSLSLPYHPLYYPELLQACGFQKHSDYVSGELRSDFRITPRTQQLAERVAERSGIRVLSTSSRRRLRQLAPELVAIYKKSGSGASMYYPLSAAEERLIEQQLVRSCCPELIHWLEDRAGRPVGVQMALPNAAEALKRAGASRWARAAAFLKQRRRPREINISMSYLLPDCQGRGLNLLLYARCQQAALKFGCRRALVGPVHEENRTALSVLKKTGVDFTIAHRLFKKEFI